MNADGQKHAFESKLNELEKLLERQLKLLRRGSIGETKTLAEQAETLVGEIAATGCFKSAMLGSKQTKLQKLYQELCLAVTARKADAAEQLEHLRKGKMTLRSYRKNV
jgi:vacuolar-type H+-ATPase subunit D/Vma8